MLDLSRNILIITPLEQKEIYNDMYIEYVTVNRVIEGKSSLEGTELKLYNDTKGFYYETDDVYKRRISKLPALGYSENDYP